MSDALKRAKAKYYQKIKDDPNYKEKMAKNSKRFYEENKEKQIEKTKNIIMKIKILYVKR
jgi:hypothetical protein